MHIAEGVLSIPVLAAATVGAVGGVTIGLRQLDNAHIPTVAVLASVFFIASLIHIPVGLSSVHLVMNGLCGLLLGWCSFPAILVALLLQAILFGFGGLTTLGVNTLIMALPAIVCYYLLGSDLLQCSVQQVFWRGALAGALAVVLGFFVMATALYLTGGQAFFSMIALVFLSYIPVMVVEGVITGTIVAFIYRVEPTLFRNYAVESVTNYN